MLDKPDLISIIIPCYNDAQFIEQALHSALNQTYPNKQIIVIDDGSDIKTKNVLKKINSNKVTIITQENSGVCVARNVGVQNAKGEYILTLDSDDYFEPGFLEKAKCVLDAYKDVGMVTCWTNVIDENDNFKYVHKPTGSEASVALYHNNSMGSNLFLKKAWEEVGGYDVNMKNGFEDWEFNISLTKKGWKVYVIPETLFNYRSKSVSRNTNAFSHQKELRSYVFKKHKDIAISNYDYTIDFFLNEIENVKQTVEVYRKSSSYRIGHAIVLFVMKIFPVFIFFKKKR